MVGIVDAELLSLGSPVSYSQILAQDPSIKLKLMEIINTQTNIDLINDIFAKMNQDQISTYEQYYNSKNLMNLLKQYEGDPELFNQNINSFENNILINNQLDDTFKDQLLCAISIAKNSHYYWYENQNAGKTSGANTARGRGVMIAGADTAGALSGIQSGAVTSAAVFGPWGSFAALVGCAAVSSMMAAGMF